VRLPLRLPVPLRRVARSPLAYWVVVVALAVFTASTVARLVDSAAAQAARYGRLRPVVTAAHDVEAGAVLRPADVAVRSMPGAFLPEGAVGATAAAVGRTVVVPLFRGAAVLASNLAPDGLQGLAALLPPDTRAVAVPTGTASVPLRRGDRVDVLATFDPPPAGEEPTFPVAESALVVDIGPEAASVAVGPDEAKRVAFAVASGTVTLAVTAGVRPAGPVPQSPPALGTPRTAGKSGSAPPSARTTPPPGR
jgi:pilus assembly protein CpaB